MDKILYTGSLEIIPLSRGEQLARGMKRLGVGLKTTVRAYKSGIRTASFSRRGKLTTINGDSFLFTGVDGEL